MRKTADELSVEERLFIGVFPCGISYADRAQRVGGDYKRLAFLPFRSLQLEWCPNVPPALVGPIIGDAAVIQGRRGQPFEISASGQCVILGE